MRRLTSLSLNFAILIALGLGFAGCAQKTTIKAIKAAKVTDGDVKHIGVLPFGKDTIGQAEQIDASIAGVEIKGKKYFNLVDRANLSKVMKEQSLNDSGLVDLIKGGSSSGLAEVKTLVTGKVHNAAAASSKFKESRTDRSTCVAYGRTKKGTRYCIRYRKYNVNCEAKNFTVQTSIKLIKVANAKVMFGKTYKASKKYKHCSDDSNVIPTKEEAGVSLAGKISKDLMVDIAPSYVYFTVTLLDDPDIKYNDKSKKLLKLALKLIDQKRIEKANEKLKKLNASTNSNSYVALYNLAITEEALGNVETAYKLYKKADDIALETKGEVVEEISFALKRAKKNLAELKKANKQQSL